MPIVRNGKTYYRLGLCWVRKLDQVKDYFAMNKNTSDYDYYIEFHDKFLFSDESENDWYLRVTGKTKERFVVEGL